MDLDKTVKRIDFDKIIENRKELQLYVRLTGDILNYIQNNNEATFKEIIKNVGGSDRRVLRLLNQLVGLNILVFKKNRFTLNGNYQKEITISDVLCPYCDGKVVTISKRFEDIRKIMKEVYSNKPKPTFVFDQRPVNLETTIRRVEYLILRGDLQNKKIAIIGDDDLTSIPIALTKLAKEVVVFDIDKRLISYIKKVKKQFNLKIKVIEQDFSKKLNKKFVNYFDVFMTDPTPEKIPFIVFTNFGIKLIKKKDSVGYLSIYSSAMDKTLDLQNALNEMGLFITDIIPNFTEYDFIEYTYNEKDKELLHRYSRGEKPICFTESLVRTEATPKTKPIKIIYKQRDLFGKATKRVLNNIRLDPAYQRDKKFVENIAKKMRRFSKNE